MTEQIMALEMRIEELRSELDDMRAQFAGFDQRFRTVRQAEQRWFSLVRQRHSIVFANEAGDITKIPVSIARLLAEERAFDGVVRDDGMHLQFVRDARVVARVRKTLVRQLRGLLADSDLKTAALPSVSVEAGESAVPFPKSRSGAGGSPEDSDRKADR